MSARSRPVREHREARPDGANVEAAIGVLNIGICGEAFVIGGIGVGGVFRVRNIDCSVDDRNETLTAGVEPLDKGRKFLGVIGYWVAGEITISIPQWLAVAPVFGDTDMTYWFM